MSYSQFGQDLNALHNIYKYKRDGYFIEIGAYDGIESSNTYLMEREYGWKGICVECNPDKYNLLVKNRNCITVPNAAYSEDNKELEFYDSGGYAGLVVTNNHAHIVNDKKIIVKTKKLTTILDESKAPSFIEYLSLDTEGSEYEILREHDFSKYIFGYICVEHNNITKNRVLIRSLLESKGYRFYRENGNDTWGVIDDEYIHESIDPIKKINVAFLNHGVKECGVYQYGKRVYDILKKSTEIYYTYIEIKSIDDYNEFLKTINEYQLIIYNYHHSTMTWLNKSNIPKNIKTIGIPHESPTDMFGLIIDIDPNSPNGIPRPIFELQALPKEAENPDLKELLKIYKDNVPIFGSFGFGFQNKGFDTIVNLVNNQYDEAIIKFVMPLAAFDKDNLQNAQMILEKCKVANIKPGIIVIITHSFVSEEDILLFLSSNTMNLFLYDRMEGRGISSALDYALSVDTPIGISDSYMFRHLYDDSICVYKNSIEDCKKTSINKKYQNLYSHSKMIESFKNIILNYTGLKC